MATLRGMATQAGYREKVGSCRGCCFPLLTDSHSENWTGVILPPVLFFEVEVCAGGIDI